MFDVLPSTGWLTLLLTLLLCFVFLRAFFRGNKNLPPGPVGLPIVGYLPFLTRVPHLKLGQVAQKYGDVMSFEVLGMRFVHLNSWDAVREAFTSNDFVGRPELLPVAQQLMSNLGIIPSEGEPWKIHRRFALQTLRDFGFGKQSLEERVREIAKDILKELMASSSQPIDVKDVLAASTANVICSLVFDRHFQFDDPLFKKFRDGINMIVKNVSPIQPFLNGPIMKFLPMNRFPVVKSIIEANKMFDEVVDMLIKEHQRTFDPTYLRDYVDVFLAEMKKNEHSVHAEDKTFTIDRLKAVTFDLFIAGTETTSNTIHWALRILMFRPDVQSRIQAEIDEVVGLERLPTMADRTLMPYTEATICEVLRFSSLITIGAMHSNPEETTFRGFCIPKRSLIIANLWSVHHDPKYWNEPGKFIPERFLNSEGKFKKRDSFYPFSVGKRVCLGEALARMEIFIFFTSIFQRFHIHPVENDTEDFLEVHISLVRTLLPYKLCARNRVKSSLYSATDKHLGNSEIC